MESPSHSALSGDAAAVGGFRLFKNTVKNSSVITFHLKPVVWVIDVNP